jgi:hypothetical protein
MHAIETRPYRYGQVTLAEVGPHALARRFERARPNSEAAVLADFRPFLRAYRRAAESKVEAVSITTPSGGCWRGQLTPGPSPNRDSGTGVSIIVRTFV